jgi:hypothetical protein
VGARLKERKYWYVACSSRLQDTKEYGTFPPPFTIHGPEIQTQLFIPGEID